MNHPQDEQSATTPSAEGVADEAPRPEAASSESAAPEAAAPTGEVAEAGAPEEAEAEEVAPVLSPAAAASKAAAEKLVSDAEALAAARAADAEADFEVEDIDDEDDNEDAAPIEEAGGPGEGEGLQWYILKVQSNRENSICQALKRRVAVEGLEPFFDEILVPTEDIAEFKGGKRRVVKRKLYPGYIVVHMIINDDTWFLVRETPGIGDFTGSAGRPTPMLTHEVERILQKSIGEDEDGEQVKTSIPFKGGDRVRIREGTFENFEGDVEGIDEANGRITVMINIFGRSTPVELEYWQAESV